MQNETPSSAADNPGPVIRWLRDSKRVSYLLQRVIVDGTLSLNPFAWIPILFTGPRPLSAPGLRKALRSWSRRRFRGTGCETAVRIVENPPALLDDGSAGVREGVVVEARCLDGNRIACFHAWYAADGSRGAYAVFDEGDTEIATIPLDPATDEGQVIGALDRAARAFVGDHLLLSAFEDWLESYSPGWRWIEPPVSPAILDRHNGYAWRYALVPRDGKETIIGLSALDVIKNVEAGVFFADAQGVLVQQNYVGTAQSPADLRALLTKNFGQTPDDVILAAWMLHRVVPPLTPAK